MRKIIPMFLLVLPFQLFAQNYSVSLIPDSLKKNANVVKRFEEISIIVKDIDKAVIKRKYAITILNEKGDQYSWYSNDYDKLTDLSDISGTLYDQNGKEIKSVKRKDINDESYDDGFSLMRDSRIKSHNFYYRQYPYTVEYEDEQTYNGIYAFPEWDPIKSVTMSVQDSRFSIETPADYKLRYKQFNYAGEPVIKKEKTTTYTWEIRNIKVFDYERYLPDYHELMPYVYVAPTDFSYGGYTGKMDTWMNFGKYQVELNKGRDELPEDIKKQVHTLTDNISDPKEKIRVLYEYMQKNTRYISIQLGIGGLQPFDAKFVATNRYGDCKALSNYMHSLLKEAGINGYYVQITAGEDEKFFIPDFPDHQANHVIICVPLQKDSMWLECTDQDIPAGYLGSFTDDRYALMIKEDGGYLVKTPRYGSKENTVSRHIEASIDETGKLTADINTTYRALEQDDLFSFIHHYPKDKQMERLKGGIDLPTYDIDDFSYAEHKASIPSIDENIKLSSQNYASVSGKRIFVAPNILSRHGIKLTTTENRKYDIVYEHSLVSTDSITIKIPSGYSIEAMPKNLDIDNQFGTYNIRFNVADNIISCTRSYRRKEGRFPPSDYQVLVKFYDDMFKADRSKIVFVKKEG